MDRLDRLDSDDVIPHGEKSYHFRWVALDKRVLIVEAKSKGVNHGAYVGAVKGVNYYEEAIDVVANGSLLPDLMAEAYFRPDISVPFKELLGKEPFDPESYASTEWSLERPLAILDFFSLDKHVMLVAVGHLTPDALGHPDDKWTAYIGAVKGEDPYTDSTGVVSEGSKVPLEFAEVAFEDLGKATRYGHLKWEGVEEVDRSVLFGSAKTTTE